MNSLKKGHREGSVYGLILVAALGYFVDIYDLILYNVVKVESLNSLGLSEEEIKHYDMSLFNWQMTGMLIGGILWGILGDRKGRIQVLFGSILMYSLANIANAFVDNTTTYALWRLVAGIGLAGELGAGITLVVESMEKEKRGYGTMLIVTLGAMGGVAARLVGNKGAEISQALGTGLEGWRMAYIVGGFLGLILLLLRAGTYESGMFRSMHSTKARKGNFLGLFTHKDRFIKYMACIAIGLPVWFVVGVLINQSHTLSEFIGVNGKVLVGDSVMYCYIGLSVGDLLSGVLSQVLKSRRKVVFIYLGILTLLIPVYLYIHNVSLAWFHGMCFLLGAATGFWALFVTIASEQFGTNLRSTVSNTVPNFVRGSTVLITGSYSFLTTLPFSLTPAEACIVVGGICIFLSFLATYYISETFTKDLNYLETS